MVNDVYCKTLVRLSFAAFGMCLMCGAHAESDEAKALRADLSGFARHICEKEPPPTWWRDMLNACKKTRQLKDKAEAASILTNFQNELLSSDLSGLSCDERSQRIYSIAKFTWVISGCFPGDRREYWGLRHRAIAGIKEQVDKFANDGPMKDPDMKERFKKDPYMTNFRQFIDRKKDPTCKYDNWWHCFSCLLGHMYDFVGTALYDIEEGSRCPPELREWSMREIERILGHPVVDADYGNSWHQVAKLRKERKIKAHEDAVRKPHDGGDVLPHPFTFLGCTFGNAYEVSRRGGKDALDDVILCWYSNFAIEPYFGKKWMMLNLAPRSKIAYLAEISWNGQNTREELFAFAKDIRADIEKRLGVKLGEFFFEDRSHVCDEATWWKVDWGCARSRSVFGPILIELEAADQPGNRFPSSRCLSLTITDKAAEALVEKERKENPLTFDSKAEEEAERRRFERLKELSRQRKAMKDAQKQPQP